MLDTTRELIEFLGDCQGIHQITRDEYKEKEDEIWELREMGLAILYLMPIPLKDGSFDSVKTLSFLEDGWKVYRELFPKKRKKKVKKVGLHEKRKCNCNFCVMLRLQD